MSDSKAQAKPEMDAKKKYTLRPEYQDVIDQKHHESELTLDEWKKIVVASGLFTHPRKMLYLAGLSPQDN